MKSINKFLKTQSKEFKALLEETDPNQVAFLFDGGSKNDLSLQIAKITVCVAGSMDLARAGFLLQSNHPIGK